MRARMSVNIRLMPTFRLISLLVLLGLPLSGCTWAKSKGAGLFAGMLTKKAAKNTKKGEFKMVGLVEMVNPEQSYVLINCDQRMNLPAGTELIAQNTDGTRVKLKVTPERKGNYITADIQEGVPQVRDLVLQQIKPGDLPAPGALAGTAGAATPTVSGAPVNLTPIMQADVIPPLDAPFQPMSPARPAALPQMPSPAPPMAAPQAAPAPARTQPSQPEPEPDGTGLPPVIR